jgi:hypothetical protein
VLKKGKLFLGFTGKYENPKLDYPIILRDENGI